MTILAKWTVNEYHRMIQVGILQDRRVELLAGEIHAQDTRRTASYLLWREFS